MSWIGGFKGTKAENRYVRRVFVAMVFYIATLSWCKRLAEHTHYTGWVLYLIALLPAIPVLVTLGAMGRYLIEETDEYLRRQMVVSLLASTGLLLSVIVVNDFLRILAHAKALEPITCFVVFMMSFGLAQCGQKLWDLRGRNE
jgi:hypothetical protein